MKTSTYEIVGSDYEHAGSASSSLKKQLKQIGVESGAVRRAMIAAYEAEMNVVIHARKGKMVVNVDNGLLDVMVQDEGPGIPDIAKAMEEGYSTAPEEARALGFGAGMGLPNIKRHTDRLSITSTVGKGTRLSFGIHFESQLTSLPVRHSLRVTPELCQGCFRCVFACPTQAMRVHESKPEVLSHLCIDCAACIDACQTGALSMDALDALPKPSADTVLVLPAEILVQFGPSVGPERVLAVLHELGFADVRVASAWEAALRRAVAQYAADTAQARPVISPICPGVVNLIETRFPSLIGNLAPFLSPIEAIMREVAGHPLVLVALCPCQRAAIGHGSSTAAMDVVPPSLLSEAILRHTSDEQGAAAAPIEATGNHDQSGDAFAVSGVRHCIRVLERTENGLLAAGPVIELHLCDQGCLGSPLLLEDAFVSRHQWPTAALPDPKARALRRAEPFAARPGVRLDRDMSRAIAKLGQIDALTKRLPGRNCAMCGAPTCAALAEDIVLGRAEIAACAHHRSARETRHDS